MSCYTYNIILKLFIFGLKYNGLAIMRKTTKLIEGGHRGLQESIDIYDPIYGSNKSKMAATAMLEKFQVAISPQPVVIGHVTIR